MKRFAIQWVLSLALGSAVCVPAVQAQDEAASAAESEAPLYQGTYFAPMASYLRSDGKHIDNGYGGVLAGGYRQNWYAFEFSAVYHELPSNAGGNANEVGGSLNVLLFPFTGAANLFVTLQGGGIQLKHYPDPPNKEMVALTTFGAGIGNLFPITVGNYEFAIRAEAIYRMGLREENHKAIPDIDAPRRFDDVLINIGLQLPIGSKAPPPTPVPVAVVPTAALCSDQIDNDGDGKIDFPADSGCASADDNDETDPPACSDGKDNDGDGLVDFPADKGCTAIDDTDETDLCRTPAAGERVSLTGCSSGDVIVLRGVNFEFDKARLTPNAKTILDGVADELTANPEIRFELGGHTDAKGSDEYNQRLSEERANSVLGYLSSKNITDDRMTAVGYGESQPASDNDTEAGRELNRRVELKITGGAAAAVAPAEVAAPAVAAPVDAVAEPEAAPTP